MKHKILNKPIRFTTLMSRVELEMIRDGAYREQISKGAYIRLLIQRDAAAPTLTAKEQTK